MPLEATSPLPRSHIEPTESSIQTPSLSTLRARHTLLAHWEFTNQVHKFESCLTITLS